VGDRRAAAAPRLGVVLAVADNADFSAQFADGLHLVRRHQLRQADAGVHAEHARGVGQRPAVVAGGGRDHALGLLLIAKLSDRVARAAQLEAAGDLLGFELEVHRRPEQTRQAGRMLQRRLPHQALDALACSVQLDEGNQLHLGLRRMQWGRV